MREKEVQRKREEEINKAAKVDAAEMREKEVQRKREEEINKAAKVDAEQPFFEGSILDRSFYDGIDREHIRREETIKLLKNFEEMYSNLYHMKEFIDNTLVPYYRDGNHEINKIIEKSSYNTLNTIKMSLLDFYPSDILSMVEKGSVDYESFDLDGCIKQILLNFFDRTPKRTIDLDNCVFNIYNMIYLFEHEIEKQDYVGAGRRRYKNHSKRKINTKKIRTNKKNSKKQKSKVASIKKQKSKVSSKKKQKSKTKNNKRQHKSTLKR
jgi:hypothetical protein